MSFGGGDILGEYVCVGEGERGQSDNWFGRNLKLSIGEGNKLRFRKMCG